MIFRFYISLLFLCIATPLASDGPTQTAEGSLATYERSLASQKLLEADQMLAGADREQNRVRALTQTLWAYETALAALRIELQQAALKEAALSNALTMREREVTRLLSSLAALERSGGPGPYLHPAGALGTARAGMILADVTPALDKQVETLRSQLHQIRALSVLQLEATESLSTGLKAADVARIALTEAVANRSELPRRFIEDPVKTALLVASSETITEFAGSIDVVAASIVPGSLPDISDRRGRLSLPVVDAHIDQRSASGGYPALHLSTSHEALVTTPVPAALRYRGPLLDYGNVVILEPHTGILIVMAGLETVFGEIGQVLPGGSPVGFMPGPKAPDLAKTDAHLSADETSAGSQGPQSLYIEIRENNVPVDPLTWFAATEG